ncbi:CHAT domain-containing protein [Bradyrhizobium brasilense]|uniref:CHAT domain-containing protein n=1 Tax=Bradyrhizobium brasilense TaxID=1419277 RepID=UPI001E4B6485|nr:tetratricopeptide repeat protein [Bradyrhizobium brasilense]MCC8968903.1 CHAT domain-containing protein [Bradyrhizobium brasilense]
MKIRGSFAIAIVLAWFTPATAQRAIETAISSASTSSDNGNYRDALKQLDAIAGGSALPMPLRRRISTIRAQALLGEAYYDAALAPAQAAVVPGDDLSKEDSADGLLLIARIEMQRGGNAPAISAALEQALRAAADVDGPAGLRTMRVEDRVALDLSTSRPAEAEAMIRGVIVRADGSAGVPQRDKLRFVNTLGITLIRQSKFGAAKEAFESARNGRRELLSESHPETLESTHNLGVALRRLGETKEADAAFGEALRLRSAILGTDHPDTLITRTMIVRQLIDKSDFETATTEAQAVCAALTARLGEADVRTLEAMGDLATAQFNLGKVSEGVETYRRAYALATVTLGETTPEAMNIGHEYAGLLYRAGRYGEALAIFQRVLTATRQKFDDENRDTIATLHSIAVVLSDLGRNDDAIVIYRYVLSVLEKQVPETHPSRLSALNNLAAAYRAAGRFEDASKAIDDVVRIRTATRGAEAALTLVSRSNQAAILAALKRYPEAIAAHRDIYSIRTARLGERHPDTLKSLHNLASTLSDAGMSSDARPLFEKVLALRSEVLGPRNVDTVTTMRDLAFLFERNGEAEQAIQLYLKIVDAAESLRVEGGLPDTLRRSYFATVAPAYKSLAALEAKSGNFGQALRAADLSKARTLLDISSARGVARNILSPEERAELSDLEFRIARLDEQIPSLTEVGTRSDAEARRNALSAKFAETNSALEKKYPTYHQTIASDAVDEGVLARLLPRDAALLDLVQTGAATVILWMTGTGERGSIALPDSPNFAATLQAYRAVLAKPGGVDELRYPSRPGAIEYHIWKLSDGSFQMRKRQEGAPEGGKIVSDATDIRNSISTWLLGSLPKEVIAAKRWFICPDGPFSLLPFDTLTLDGHLVGEMHDVSFVQSISMLGVSIERLNQYSSISREPMLAVGNSLYQTTSDGTKPQRAIDALRGPTGDPLGNIRWPDLPGTGNELAALTQLFDLKQGTNLFTRGAASQSTVRRLQAEGTLEHFRHIVFAAHGYLNADVPDLSAIVLSQVQLGPGEDGYLRAPELASYDFRSDLVFVSACETGIGRLTTGEGILGLPFALQAGGNAATVLTLWQIVDGTSADFVARFFTKVKAGLPSAAALAETKREFIRGDAGDQGRSPSAWAAFIYYGN